MSFAYPDHDVHNRISYRHTCLFPPQKPDEQHLCLLLLVRRKRRPSKHAGGMPQAGSVGQIKNNNK